MIFRSFLVLLLISVTPSDSLLCYECSCDQNTLSSCDCGATTSGMEPDYCVIFIQKYTDTVFVQLTRIPRNSTWVYIEDPYYILTQEYIRYNRSTNQWNVRTNGVVFGCDWDNCNSPNLINALPESFQLEIDSSWLDTNIYGTGTVKSCHHCPVDQCSSPGSPIDFSKCPLTLCENSTSCVAYDLWTNIDTNDQCYQSQCAPSYLDEPNADLYGGKYRVELEAIVYLAGDRSKYEIWEIDVYCGANNCTRPTIFKEIVSQLQLDLGDLSAFPPTRPAVTTVAPTPIPNPIRCYDCECFGTSTCPCATTVVASMDYSYCVIVREDFGENTYIYSYYLDFDATFMYVNEFPFVLVEETINYDDRGSFWYTTTNFVIYGCNWNLCNKADLIPLLPNSFQMRLPEPWLNENVLGNGQPVRDCHECPNSPECGTIEYLDSGVCPIKSCNTTCLVLDLYDDPYFDYVCYQSFCLPPDTDDFEFDRHRVEIEGIVYASDQKNVQIWEIDIYCRADNCSRPQILKELRQQLRVQPGTLATVFNETHDPNIPQRKCYDCYCYNDLNCACDKVTLRSAESSYCILMREDYGQDSWISMGHIDEDSTRVHVRDFPYLVVDESIRYNERTGKWNTLTNFVVYGCDWDLCNHPNLVPYLPASFQMRLPEQWLNSSILGSGQPVRDCHECPEAPQCGSLSFLDAARCPIKACNTSCLVFDTFDDPALDLQCYQSFCAPPDTEEYDIEDHLVEMEGILYLDKVPRTVELWEIDVYCRADDCSRPELFNEIKEQFTTELGDLSMFESAKITTTTEAEATTTDSASSLQHAYLLFISSFCIIFSLFH